MNDQQRVFSRSHADEVDIALSAIDCVLNGEKAVYASSELTTGRLVSSVLRETGLENTSDLRRHLGDHEYTTRIWDRNVAAATAFARKLHHSLGGNQIVITPAPFMARGWNQSEYLSFWRTLIRSRIKAVYFNENWEYSNGCAYELVEALDAGLPTFEARGEPLAPSRAAALIERAIAELRAQGLNVEVLSGHLGRLESVRNSR